MIKTLPLLYSFCISHALSPINLKTTTKFQTVQKKQSWTENNDKRQFQKCPNPPKDDDLDRREALFSMMGSMWSIGLLSDAIMVGGASNPAQAVVGADANMEFPDIVGGMSDRVNKQCVVESLGTRQCLLYMDPANAVYQGYDAAVLLERIEVCSRALATIPDLANDRKWSKISGVLTGPMGTLVSTMNQLASGRKDALDAAKKVKNDIVAINQASEKKDQAKVLSLHQQATNDLVTFVTLI